VAASYGASALINHVAGDLRSALRAAAPDGADVVVAPVGGDLAEPALRTLRWGGRFVTVGYASGTVPRIPLNLVLLKGCQVLGFQFRSFAANEPEQARRNEAELLALLAAGRTIPHVGTTFPLSEASAALRHVADGKAIGKVVLEIGLPARPACTPSATRPSWRLAAMGKKRSVRSFLRSALWRVM